MNEDGIFGCLLVIYPIECSKREVQITALKLHDSIMMRSKISTGSRVINDSFCGSISSAFSAADTAICQVNGVKRIENDA